MIPKYLAENEVKSLFSTKEVIDLFKRKLEEEGGDTDLEKYRINLGRLDDEIKDMRFRVKEELFAVLTLEEQLRFNLDTALERINNVMGKMSTTRF